MEKLIAAWNWLVALVLGWFKKAPATPAAPGVPDVGDSLKSKIAEGEKEAGQRRVWTRAMSHDRSGRRLGDLALIGRPTRLA